VRFACLLAGLLLAASPVRSAGETAPEPGVDLIIQTDSRGELQPCHCPGMPSGGFSRRSEVFKIARHSGERIALVLEGGDFLPDLEDSLSAPLADFLPGVLVVMDYDAMALGERELFRGPDYLTRLAGELPLVCANVTVGGAPVAPAVRWFRVGERRVAVTGFLDPLLFYAWPDAFTGDAGTILVSDPVEALTAVRAELDSADAVVVLAHAGLDRVLEWGPELDFVDVLVQTHEPGLSEHPGRAGDAFVVEPGPRSRQVVRAHLEWPDTTGTASPVAVTAAHGVSLDALHVWDLKRTVRFDAHVEERVQQFLDSLAGR